MNILQFVSDLLGTAQAWLTQSSLIPTSVIVAVLIFITREWLEFHRKKRAKRNEISALKIILARECELNWYLSKQINEICSVFEPYERGEDDCPYELQIVFNPSGKKEYEIIGGEHGMSGGALPDPYVTTFDKYRYDVVKMDVEFYGKLEAAFDAAIKLKHLHDWLLDIGHTAQRMKTDNMMIGFSGYALSEIIDINECIKSLHKFCTGKEKITSRLR